MRNVLKSLLLASIILALPALSLAADKIGVVSSDLVLQNSSVGKKTLGDLQTKVENKQRELQRMNDELKRMGDDYQKKAVTLSAEAKSRAQADMEAKARKMMEDQQSFGQQMETERQKAMDPLFKVFEQVLTDYAKKNGYSIIVERRAVLFVDGAADVTPEITKAFEAAAKK